MATITVKASGGTFTLTQLQNAIDAAVDGDTITIEAGQRCTGQFILRNKGTLITGITITTDADPANLPAAGVRTGPAYAAFMPRIKSSGGGAPAIRTANGANHWTLRHVYLENVPFGFENICNIGDNDSTQTFPSQMPSFITIDRCIGMGGTVCGQKRFALLHGANLTVSNCYFDNIFSYGADSQTLTCVNGTGPITVTNNWMRGGTYSFMAGGADPTIRTFMNITASTTTSIDVTCSEAGHTLAELAIGQGIGVAMTGISGGWQFTNITSISSTGASGTLGIAAVPTAPTVGTNTAKCGVILNGLTFRFNHCGNDPAWFNRGAIDTPTGLTSTTGAGTLAAGTYYYSVQAQHLSECYEASANTGYSLRSGETTKTLAAPGAVALAWAAVTNAEQYIVWRGTSPLTPTQFKIVTGGATTSLADAGAVTWTAGTPQAGSAKTFKNIFELKACVNGQIDSNIFEYVTQGGDVGFAVWLKTANQSGDAVFLQTKNIVFEKNIIRHCFGVIEVHGRERGTTSMGYPGALTNLTIRNNLCYDSGPAWSNSGSTDAYACFVASAMNVTIDHNTIVHVTTGGGGGLCAMDSGDVLLQGFAFKNNLCRKETFGFHDGGGLGNDGAALTVSTTGGYVFTNNAIADGGTLYPAGNPTESAALWQQEFVNYVASGTGADFHLKPTSAYHHAGTDGLDLGADIDLVLTATATVMSGIPGTQTTGGGGGTATPGGRVFTKNLANYMSLGVGSLGTLLHGKAAFSVHAKIKPTATTISEGGILLSALVNATSVGLSLGVTGGTTRISARSGASDAKQTVSGATSLTAGVDAYLGATIDVAGDALRVYLNGVSDGSATVLFGNATFTLGTPTDADMVGGFKAPPTSTIDQVDGVLSEIAVWGSVLAAADYATLATGAAADTVSGSTLLYYLKIGGVSSPEGPTVGTALGTITGSLPPPAGSTVALTGVQATGSGGVLAPTGSNPTTALTGVAATAARGSVTASGGNLTIAALTGVAATGSGGTLTPAGGSANTSGRVFTKNLANYMSLGNSGLGTILNGAAVVSVDARIRIAGTTTGQNDNDIVAAIVNGVSAGLVLSVDGTSTKLRCAARSAAADVKQALTATTALVVGVDYYVGAVVDFTGKTITLFLNGVSDGTVASLAFANNTFTLGTPTDADVVGGFRAPPLATTDQFNGVISEIAVWTSALTAGQFATLATGVAATTVGSPAYYLKIGGSASPELATVGTPSGTITGSLPPQASSTVTLSGLVATPALGTVTGGGANTTNVPLAGVGGLGALGAVTPTTVTPWSVSVEVGGALARTRVSGCTIHDALNDAPNTCSLTIDDLNPPTDGADVRIAIGSAQRVLFAGTLQTTDVSYSGERSVNRLWPCTAIDYTARANMRRPRGTYVNVSATTIGQALVSGFAPAFSTTFIAAALPAVSITFDGSEDWIACLARLANAIGGYCKVEDMDAYLFLTDPSAPPNPIDVTHPPLNDPPLHCTIDDRQLRTRVYGKGHGEAVPSDVASGETTLPVADATLFNASGGQVIAGTTPDGAQSEVLGYTGVQLGGGGSLVGPGAAPTVAATLALAAGAGLGTGIYSYAYTDGTAAGESLPSPIGTISVGTVAAPLVAPAPGSPTVGGSVTLGVQDYQVTFVTAAGETIPGPVSAPVTTQAVASNALPDPSGAPTPGTLTGGGAMDAGTHHYVATFTNALGETLPGPISAGVILGGTVTVGSVTPPATTPSISNHVGPAQALGSWNVGDSVAVSVTYRNAAGETTAGPVSNSVVIRPLHDFDPVSDPFSTIPFGIDLAGVPVSTDPTVVAFAPGLNQAKRIYFKVNGTYAGYDRQNNNATDFPDQVLFRDQTSPPTTNTAVVTGPSTTVAVTIPTGPTGTTGRKLYRRFNGTGLFKLVTTIPNNSATIVSDTVANANLGAAAPTSNTTATITLLQTVPVTGIPLGGVLVTSRKLYRRFNVTGTFKLVTTIANNTATTFSDTVANGSLGAAAPSSNTATANQVTVTSIAVGPTNTTTRKLYRTAVGGSQLKLLTTLANNTTTTFADSTADGSLGANVPTSDTSGLTQPTGQVNAFSATLIAASAGPFFASGGWAAIGGGQTIRYTGITGNTLTGIPTSGPGAITTTVVYGSQVLPAPALTGVTGLTKAMAKGALVHIWVQRDDVAAQLAAAVRETTDTFTSDGIHEYLITDDRRTEASLRALCDADLVRFGRPIITFTYATRDVNTKSGKPVHINLPGYPVGDYVIQDVVIDQIGLAPTLPPRFTVTASSVLFSLEQILRQLIGQVS